MDYRFLGRSGLRVSTLAFGALTFGGKGAYAAHGDTQQADADRIVALAMDAGVNLFDTANSYSMGESERILGKALGNRRREIVLTSKVYTRVGEGPNDTGLSRHHIIAACEQSLRNLGTDYIDLYRSHGQDLLTPIDETLRAYDDLIRTGKVRYIGSSNYTGWQKMKALATSERLGLPRYICQQINYSLMCRDVEQELVPLGLDQGVGILAYAPLASGLLSGKFRRDAPMPEGSRIAELGMSYAPFVERDRLFKVIDVMDRIAPAHGATLSQIAIAWVLHKPGVSATIFGARNESQLKDNLRAAEIRLAVEDVAALDAASEMPLPYPYWHHRKYAAERNPVLPTYRTTMVGE